MTIKTIVNRVTITAEVTIAIIVTFNPGAGVVDVDAVNTSIVALLLLDILLLTVLRRIRSG
mgnify:FL=1